MAHLEATASSAYNEVTVTAKAGGTVREIVVGSGGDPTVGLIVGGVGAAFFLLRRRSRKSRR